MDLTSTVLKAINKIFVNTERHSVDVKQVFDMYLCTPYSYGMQQLIPPTGSQDTQPYISVSIYRLGDFIGWFFVHRNKCTMELQKKVNKETLKHLYAIKNTLSYFGNYADLELKAERIEIKNASIKSNTTI